MKIDFKINCEKDREPKILRYFSLFANMSLLGEDETITDIKIDDVPIEDNGFCVYYGLCVC